MPNDSYFGVTVRFPELDFKETMQIKAFDFNDLLGHIGGYIGMFLGYALLNFAYYIVDLFGTFINRCSKSTSICGNEKRAGLHNKTSILHDKGKTFEESSKEMEEMTKIIDEMDSRLRTMERKLHQPF